MTGSLQIKGNIYYAVLNIPDDAGKPHPKWINLKLRVDRVKKREAQKAFRDLLKQYEDSHVAYAKDVLFADWLRQWLEQMQYAVERSTWDSYKVFAERHILPYFEPQKVTLMGLTPQMLQRYYNVMVKNGRLDGRGGLSANTVKKHHVVIHSALKDAVRKNLIPYNPAERVTLPKVQQYVGNYYNAEQAAALIEAIRGDPFEPVILLTLFYGLRRSEVLGLKWAAVDFEEGRIHIQNTVVQSKVVVEKERTKNKKSRRTLPLIPEMERYLRRLKQEQRENQLLMGAGYVRNDFVCKWPDGLPFRPDVVSRGFRRLLKRHHLPDIRFHDLRHSCASLLLARGFQLKEISEWLGHSDIGTTGNIYGHLEYQSKMRLADGMGELLHMRSVSGDKGSFP